MTTKLIESVPLDRYWLDGNGRPQISTNPERVHGINVRSRGSFEGADRFYWSSTLSSTSSGHPTSQTGMTGGNLTSRAYNILNVGYYQQAGMRHIIGFSCYIFGTSDGKNNVRTSAVGGIWDGRFYKLDSIGPNTSSGAGWRAFRIPSTYSTTVRNSTFNGVIQQVHTDGSGSVNSNVKWGISHLVPIVASSSSPTLYEWKNAPTQKTHCVLPIINGASTTLRLT